MMEVVVTTGAISGAKLQSNHHHQQTNIQYEVENMYAFRNYEFQDIARMKLQISVQGALSYRRKPSGHYF